MMNGWSSRATSYGELLTAGICYGFPVAGADATAPAVVAEMGSIERSQPLHDDFLPDTDPVACSWGI